jgi:long-chain fatty acid transport protein
MLKRSTAISIIFLLCLILPASKRIVVAGGYAIPPQTAKTQSMGGAAVAGVDDPSAVHVNPGALTQIQGDQFLGGLTYVNTISSVMNSGATSRNLHDDDFLPNFFGNYHIPNTNLALGMAGYTPYGLATTYSSDSFTRYAALRSELRTMFITPTIAWEPLRYLSVGAGVSFVHASGVLSRAIFFGPFGDGKLRITDTDNAYGYKFGFLLKPTETVRFGLTFTSNVDLNFSSADAKFTDASGVGGTRTTTKASGIHLPLPRTINAGVHWQVNPDWGVEFEYDFAQWNEFKNLKATFAIPLPGLGGAVPISGFLIPEDWHNSSSVRFGSAYKLTQQFELRAGLGLDQTPIPSKTLGPAIPGADYMTLTGGLGYTWRQLKLDLGYMAVFYKTRRVNNSVLETGGDSNALPFPGVPGKDKYRIFQNLVGLHARYAF